MRENLPGKTIAAVTGAVLVCLAVGLHAEERVPLARELHTGYLLNCSFRAIRPYAWKKQPWLSGWETDGRGGTWESSPTGLYHEPEQFKFHVDWFRLHDISDKHAVTIKHQIARQHAGRITLEFRFRLPERMTGAAWELRDMKQAAVRLLTREKVLCFETGGGLLVELQPYQAGVEYGVRIEADLDEKTARVEVNGQERATRVPFLNQVQTIDYVLIRTGEEATGDLYLNPVNIYKGYQLCETFVTGQDGTRPEAWRGSAAVSTIKSCAAPDTLSLKLTGGSVERNFEVAPDRHVFEYGFMIPDPAESRVRLGRADDPVIIFATLDNDLCVIGRDGVPVPLVKEYRANFWYAVKTLVDVREGLAEVHVNQKKAAEAVACGKGATANAVSFASKKVMWVDDIKVYPWRDLPDDYVPEPKPVTDKDKTLVGVQSCSLWREGDAYAGWEYVRPFAAQRKPYLGWYDEGNSEVADWEIKWQVEHGIDFEQYCWYRPDDAVNHPIKRGVLEQGIREGLFNARYSSLKKFTIMYTNQGAGRTNPQDWRNHLVPYWIEYFFKDPRYLKVDGKPVLAIYSYKSLLEDLGGVEGATEAITHLRKVCKKAGLPDVLVLMADRYGPLATSEEMKSVGVDSLFAYHWCTGKVKNQINKMKAQRQRAAKAGIDVVPCFSNGWHTEPWGWAPARWGDDGIWATVEEYRALAKWTRDEYVAKMPPENLGARMVFLSNWNEFAEGHFLMPSNLAGFGYLDVVREVFGGGGDHEDAVPTGPQKKRFTVLYPVD